MVILWQANEVLKVLRSSQYFNDLDKIENHLYFWSIFRSLERYYRFGSVQNNRN